jgi:hypothetical protein
MQKAATDLLDTASAVAALGGDQADIDALDDASLMAAMTMIAQHEQQVGRYKLWVAASIARRSAHEAGFGGLARRNGSPTPTVLIQSLSGSSLGEAGRLAHLGSMAVEAADACDAGGREPWQVSVIRAVSEGRLTLDVADAIRRGLGVADEGVSPAQLGAAAKALVLLGATGTPDSVWRSAREMRNALDEEAIARGEKKRSDQRYVRRFRRDGMRGGSWLLPDEEGGLEIDAAFSLMLADRTGGPRFVDAEGVIPKEIGLDDERTNEQVLADGFVHLMQRGIDVDPAAVPGSRRAAVRVIVDDSTLHNRTGHAIVEGSDNSISFDSLERHLCETGTVGVMFDTDGQAINVGREQRLFTARQRIALGVRDGGCRAPGCDKPPSWTEAHHIDYWSRDRGRTDAADGILLCRYHHMLLHSNDWQIQRAGGTYWLKRPPDVDPTGALIEMPSKNSLLLARLRRSREAAS